MDPIPLPNQLKGVEQGGLQDYVDLRVAQFAHLLLARLQSQEEGAVLTAEASTAAFKHCAVAMHGTYTQQRQEQGETLRLRFAHKCKFIGCRSKECALCRNNPSKVCIKGDNFDESYADNQLLKSKCDADIGLELTHSDSGLLATMSGVEVQIVVVDGASCGIEEDGSINLESAKELHASDDGTALIGSTIPNATVANMGGLIVLNMQAGSCRLPGVHITGKNDTFRYETKTFKTFRLLARAVWRDPTGLWLPLDNIRPALSDIFTVKSQRAVNDYKKPDYPHCKDEIDKLKHIGKVTAQRLSNISVNMPVPFVSVKTVEELKELMVHIDENRDLESKLLDVLHMMGKNSHKMKHLREVLYEKVVYADTCHRIWLGPDGMGLLYACKQAIVSLDRPIGLVQQMVRDGVAQLQVMPVDAQSAELVKILRPQADLAWFTEMHAGWQIVPESVELGGLPGPSGVITQLMIGGGPGLVPLQRSSSNLSSALAMGHQLALTQGPHSALRGPPSGLLGPQSSAPMPLVAPQSSGPPQMPQLPLQLSMVKAERIANSSGHAALLGDSAHLLVPHIATGPTPGGRPLFNGTGGSNGDNRRGTGEAMAGLLQLTDMSSPSCGNANGGGDGGQQQQQQQQQGRQQQQGQGHPNISNPFGYGGTTLRTMKCQGSSGSEREETPTR
ncbi:hypothetical protein FOA52_010690 [Chlamydomonas sp. UWO 241]|nr:hypothetical protein FOA52_010690 [Chlamydomonas sp. UWO 241]